MAAVEQQIREHDTVTLRAAAGPWPSGRSGTVVSVYDDELVLVEIADSAGRTLDLVRVPIAQLDVARR